MVLKTHNPLLIILVCLTFLIYSCGNLEEFENSLSYTPATIKTNGLADVKGGVLFQTNNTEIDVIASFIPKNKFEGSSAPTFNLSGTIFTYSKNKITTQPLTTSINPRNNEDNHDIFLRQTEDKLLQNIEMSFNSVLSQSIQLAKRNYNLGDLWSDIKVSYTLGDADAWRTIIAKCVAITDHAYFFIESTKNVDKNIIDKYAAEFDAIYLKVTEKFNQPLDTDGNGKVIILICDLNNPKTLGYFHSADKYNRSQIAYSNEADVFYINTNFAIHDYNIPRVLGTLAHELQHMIYFDTKFRAITEGNALWGDYAGDSWLNEGLSMLAEFYTDYDSNVKSWIKYFLEGDYQGLSLTHWTSSNYGYSGLFTRYLNSKEGIDIGKRIYDSNKGGIQGVEVATGKDFNRIFENFAQTIYLANKKINNDPDYAFSDIDISKYNLSYTTIESGNQQFIRLTPYELNFIKIKGNTEKFRFPDNMNGYAFIK